MNNNMNGYPFNEYGMPNYMMNVPSYSTSQSNNNELFGTYEGYIKGNMFKNLYKPYKNYRPSNIEVNSAKQEELLNLSQIEFATHELNLYLDNYPNDNNMINEFNKLRKQYINLVNQYEQKYGPLFVRGIDSKVPWQWNNEPWPWERGSF